MSIFFWLSICYLGLFEAKNHILKIVLFAVWSQLHSSVFCFTLGEPDQIGADMWDYQACTEMIMPMCFDGVADMFEKAEWNETEVIETCQAKWKVKPRIKMADIMYGSKELHGSSNIIFR